MAVAAVALIAAAAANNTLAVLAAAGVCLVSFGGVFWDGDPTVAMVAAKARSLATKGNWRERCTQQVMPGLWLEEGEDGSDVLHVEGAEFCRFAGWPEDPDHIARAEAMLVSAFDTGVLVTVEVNS